MTQPNTIMSTADSPRIEVLSKRQKKSRRHKANQRARMAMWEAKRRQFEEKENTDTRKMEANGNKYLEEVEEVEEVGVLSKTQKRRRKYKANRRAYREYWDAKMREDEEKEKEEVKEIEVIASPAIVAGPGNLASPASRDIPAVPASPTARLDIPACPANPASPAEVKAEWVKFLSM
jgi:hypothetical protein